MAEKIRVGIVGLDHWYAGLGAIRQLKGNPRTELVIVAHRDLGHARPVIEEAGAIATDDYDAVVERDDLHLVITACTTVENVRLCSKAARSGKHIISVKPYAMNLDEAKALTVAVKEGGVHFMSFECMGRLGGATNIYKQWIQEGKLGDPISAFALMRSSLPDHDGTSRGMEELHPPWLLGRVLQAQGDLYFAHRKTRPQVMRRAVGKGNLLRGKAQIFRARDAPGAL